MDVYLYMYIYNYIYIYIYRMLPFILLEPAMGPPFFSICEELADYNPMISLILHPIHSLFSRLVN